MKALMFGGAFNPPTKAHIELADTVRKNLGYDKVVFVPTKLHYITQEQKKDFAFSDEQRLAMLQKVANMRDCMMISDYEINALEQPRSYTTLCHLKEKYGFTELRLLFGSDKLIELENGWKHVDDICKQFGIVCMARSQDHPEEVIENSDFLKQYQEDIYVVYLDDMYRNMSSSEVRKQYLYMKNAYELINTMIPEELDGLIDEMRNQ